MPFRANRPPAAKTGSRGRGDAKQLELVGMTGEVEISTTVSSYIATAATAGAESAAVGTA